MCICTTPISSHLVTYTARYKFMALTVLYCLTVELYTKGFVYLQIPIHADDYIVGKL